MFHFNVILVVSSEKLGRKCNVASETQTRVLWHAIQYSVQPGMLPTKTLLTQGLCEKKGVYDFYNQWISLNKRTIYYLCQ